MRSFIAAIILFAVLTVALGINSFFVCRCLGRISQLAESCASTTAGERGNYIEDMSALWEKRRPFLDMSILAGELERMDEFIAALAAAHDSGRDADIKRYCRLIQEHCAELARHEKISLQSLA